MPFAALGECGDTEPLRPREQLDHHLAVSMPIRIDTRGLKVQNHLREGQGLGVALTKVNAVLPVPHLTCCRSLGELPAGNQ